MLPAVARASSPLAAGTSYLLSRQQPDGGFAEPGSASTPGLTAWVVLGLRAAGADPAGGGNGSPSAADYLRGQDAVSATDLELQILALDALGADVSGLADRLEQLRAGSGRIGPAVNSTIWGIIALRAAGRPAGTSSVSFLTRSQRRGGGWAWSPGAGVDSNDSAAAIEALRAAGVSGRSASIRRGLAYLRSLRNPDGGFGWAAGSDSDAQSTAWALQAFAAAGLSPGKASLRYLAGLRRADGSYRYSARYSATPVWITAQALAALAGKPFPLR
ncbi:MAG: hypothetical protein ACXVZ1_00100 [Gaiellaceae bacterium]